jgi:hypothetical protein
MKTLKVFSSCNKYLLTIKPVQKLLKQQRLLRLLLKVWHTSRQKHLVYLSFGLGVLQYLLQLQVH